MAFSSSDAAFEGFRLTREKPVGVLTWAGVQLLGSIAFTLLSVTVIGADMQALQEFNRNPPEDPEAVLAIFPVLAKVLLIGLPVRLLVWALIVTAIYRAVLRPQAGGLGWLRFGADEFRQFLLCVVVTFILIAAVMGTTVAVTLVAAGVGMIAGGSSASGGMAVLITLLSMIALVAVYLWLLVRLSLSGPMTFIQGRLAIGEAWRMTRGNFWALAGTYAIALVLAIVVALLGGAIMMAVVMGVGGGFGAVSQMMNPEFATLESLASPVMIVTLICSALLNALQTVILIAPSAVAYRQISGDSTVDTFA